MFSNIAETLEKILQTLYTVPEQCKDRTNITAIILIYNCVTGVVCGGGPGGGRQPGPRLSKLSPQATVLPHTSDFITLHKTNDVNAKYKAGKRDLHKP